jgi:hypothetical protein
MPVILVTWETEVRRIRKMVHETSISKIIIAKHGSIGRVYVLQVLRHEFKPHPTKNKVQESNPVHNTLKNSLV